MPLLGEVQAAGLTPSQLEQDITGRLLKFITKPQVTVMVEQVNSKKVNVLGQVAKPGSYSLALAPTVVDAIAAANGPKEFASKNPFTSSGRAWRRPDSHCLQLQGFLKGKTQNVKLEPHDTVVVPEVANAYTFLSHFDAVRDYADLGPNRIHTVRDGRYPSR